MQLGITASGSRFNRSIAGEVKSHDVIYDLKIPLYFLFGIILIKSVFHYFQHSISFTLTDSTPNWIIYSNQLLFSLIEKFHLSEWTETFIEYLIVIGTYFIIIITKAIKKNRIQHDNLHWDEYEEKLKSATAVKALNLSLVEEFFEPMGFRYFLDQIIELKIRTTAKPLTIERVAIVSDGEKLHDSWIMNYNRSSNEMNKEYRMLHNFIELHKAHGIKLYFATKTEVLNFVKSKNKVINAKRTPIERLPFFIYFIFLILPIIPLTYFIIERLKWIWKCLLKINAIEVWNTKRKANSPISFKELDLLDIDGKYFIPKADDTETVLEFYEITDTRITTLAGEIITEFSKNDRELRILFP